MTNEYFQIEPDNTFAHPRLRRWQTLLKRDGVTASVEVSRAADLLGYGAATLYVNIDGAGNPIQDSEPWSDELNRGLVELGVAARTPEDEARRYALALEVAFESIENDVGQGFFNGVLLEQLAGGSFGARLAPTLEQIHSVRSSRDSRRFLECDDHIRNVIKAHARELTKKLGYGPAKAESILGDALEQYLDNRFHVRSRAALGWGT